jgi:hypothetical protein
MKLSLFAGLTILEPGESLSTNNGSFTARDRETIDRLLEVGAKTHRHNGNPGLLNPGEAPEAVVLASAGTIGPGLSISVGYTWEDEQGGETMLSPVTVVSTPGAMPAPQFVPSGVADYSGGSLMVNTYFYAITYTDGEGGETSIGPAVTVERQPGFASGQVNLSQLSFNMEAVGAVGWRLYRATGGGTYNLLATGDVSEDTFTDDGTHSLDCDTHPPAVESNTTNGSNSLEVTLPSAISGTFVNVYASISGDFNGGAFLGQYPLASAGAVVTYPALNFLPVSPPPVNLAIGGAHQIDPDTELIDWHWKRPVQEFSELPSEEEGTEEGDVRIVITEGKAYLFREGEWKTWVGGSGASELLEGAGMGFVFADEDLTTLRPEGFACVTWMTKGEPGEPENMAEHDILIELP